MSNRNIENLTVRLLQALDNNYDVVNMDAVLSVISALENTKITKEQLEATRLAKYINLFRRRTSSEQLAKRAKSLLKKWREMVGIQQPATGTAIIGSSELQYVGATSPILSVGGPISNVLNTGDKQTKWNTRPEDTNEPTSFVNLIPNLSSTSISANNNNNIAMGFAANGPSMRTGRKNRGFKQKTETIFNSEQLVNTTSTLNSNSTNTPTIVIDSEDSNSGSNVNEKRDDVVFVDGTTKTSASINRPSKTKKTKKEKKKLRDVQNMPTNLVVIDDAESSQSQQQIEGMLPTNVITLEKPDDRSRNSSLLPTNMSEILSLSNSSMSCVFPSTSVGESKNAFSLKKVRPLTEADLSFAGKFGGPASSSAAKNNADENLTKNAIVPSSLTGDIYVYNENSNVGGSGPTLKNLNKSRIFSGSGCNSNDSVSNSHNSNFEIVDSVSQGITNEPTNIVSALSDAAPPVPVEKVPKKRGRKKGSKGVDSLIAKDTSLSSQMLMQTLSGGSKKVKTTKELYVEMQNRKLGVSTPTTPSHWTGAGVSQQQSQQQQRRRDSFCSEPSLHSPRTYDACSTNATISTIATSSTTPDKSVNAMRKFLNTSIVDVDSSSDSLMSAAMSNESVAVRESATNTLTAIEQQLRELVQTLPPVPTISSIEEACASEIVPCSCKIKEIMPVKSEKETKTEMETKTEQPDIVIGGVVDLKDYDSKPTVCVTKSVVETVNVSEEAASSLEVAKPKKSIFDLDFDEDEDPLHSLIAEVAAAKSNTNVTNEFSKTENEALEKDEQKTFEIQLNDATTLQQNVSTSCFELPAAVSDVNTTLPLFPTYTIEEDASCLAKKRFELQTQQITEFHINLLHNFFIPNVNGNWNEAVENKSEIIEVEHKAFEVTDGSNVVPKLSDGVRLRKDLREFNFSAKQPMTKTVKSPLKYEAAPFLGVARCLIKTHRKTRKIRQKKQTEEEPKLFKADEVHQHMIENVEPTNWNSESTLKAITINVDNDEESNVVNTVDVCGAHGDTQNLLAIAANIVNFSSEKIVPPSATVYSNLCGGGDILNNNNNNNNSFPLKFEEELSSCESNSSLKQTQNSINQKLREHRRKQRRQQLELEQNSPKSSTKRKRRRKKQTTPPPIKFKCIKIAINGGITTQRHIQMKNSNSSEEYVDNDDKASNRDTSTESSETQKENSKRVHHDDDKDETTTTTKLHIENDFEIVYDDEECEHEGEGEAEGEGEQHEYADDDNNVDEQNYFSELSPLTGLGNNHIVLTIKKTPSKNNSPASNSPNVNNQLTTTTTAAETETAITTSNNKIINQTTEINNEQLNEDENLAFKLEATKRNNLIAAAYERLIEKNLNMQRSVRQRQRRRRRKRINQQQPTSFRFPVKVCNCKVSKKRHQKLFFPHEIYNGDTKQRIFNISSCSSSCNESSEYEAESQTSEEEEEVELNSNQIQNETKLKSSSSVSIDSTDSTDSVAEDSNLEKCSRTPLEVIKAEENSCCSSSVDQQLPAENNGLLVSFNDICVETKLPTSTTSLELNKLSAYDSKKLTEFQTGIRTVNDTPDGGGHVQQFKEWHQLLQLKSYNEELLTVLPYVVLD